MRSPTESSTRTTGAAADEGLAGKLPSSVNLPLTTPLTWPDDKTTVNQAQSKPEFRPANGQRDC